ncbi:MAG: hypothetical protein OEZ39_13130 [Gammaproteobacteria bacterium]|nr:hypothetical protein [Gammaproteobacteria bacterium]MDH5652792.1 hypothetical protein [Gammaproteobacteria bacterium]
MKQNQQIFSIDKLISEARRLAADYRRATGKSLGISAEIARHDACVLLNLEPVDDAAIGYDAVGRGAREGERVQIKGRAIFDETKRGQRVGQLKLEQEWDKVVLVIMDNEFQADTIYEASRTEILAAMDRQADSKRSKRGAISVARFKNIGRQVWNRDEGLIQDEIWDNRA